MAEEQDGVETAHEEQGLGEPGTFVVPSDEPVVLDADGLSSREEEDGEADEFVPTAGPAFVPRDRTMSLGEFRDYILGAFKRTPKAWSGLSEKEQTYLANEVEQRCRQVLNGAAIITASMGLDNVEVTISGTTHKTDKDQIEAKVTCPFDPDTWAAMPAHGRRTLVFADAAALMNARAAVVQKDQPGLFDMGETPEQRATREEIDREAAEHEAKQRDAAEQERLLAGFKPLDDAPGEPAADAGPTEAQAADVAAAQADGRIVDEETGEVYRDGAKPPHRAPGRTPRGRSKKAPVVAGADAVGSYQPA